VALLKQALFDAACPLFTASRKGDEQAVERLLVDGAEPNSPDEVNEGWSPLHTSAEHGHAGVCELLLEKGADNEYREPEHGSTALNLAVQGIVNTDDEPGKLRTLQVLI